MGDIIHFPTWIIEKEKELEILDFDLSVRQHKLARAEKKINDERRLYRTRMLLSFCLGLLIMGIIVLPLI